MASGSHSPPPPWTPLHVTSRPLGPSFRVSSHVRAADVAGRALSLPPGTVLKVKQHLDTVMLGRGSADPCDTGQSGWGRVL